MVKEQFLINLPNGETFRTNNEKAYELIKKIAHPYSGDDGVTKDELDEIDDAKVKEIINLFLGWNEVYCDNEFGFLMMEKHLINEWHMSGFDETFEEYLKNYYTKLNEI